jgi:hypothetical protein
MKMNFMLPGSISLRTELKRLFTKGSYAVGSSRKILLINNVKWFGDSWKLGSLVPRTISGTPGADPWDEILQRFNQHLYAITA